MTPNADSGRVIADECEECGEEPATSILHIDGVSTFVCETCLDWWHNHAALPPNGSSETP